MKQTFTVKYFDWILIVISFVSSMQGILNLFNAFEYFSTYLLRILVVSVSILVFISLIVRNMNGQRYARIFILTTLIMPAILVLSRFLIYLLFYGVNRLELLQNSILFFNFVLGVVLFGLTFIFTKRIKTDSHKDYGIFILIMGAFVLVHAIVSIIESILVSELTQWLVWEKIVSSGIGLLIMILGFRLKNNKMKLRVCLILTLILLLIYGLI